MTDTETFCKICDSLKKHIERHPDDAEMMLQDLIEGFIEPIADQDGFGTEGWRHALLGSDQ